MPEGRKTVFRGAQAEITEKKSRFIGAVAHAESEEEALAFLDSQRKMYYDARHHCSAFLAGNAPEILRSNDDGEPGGSAGRPILSVLEGAQLHDTVCVVTRYFGGTLLGVGGLIRAYTAAAQEALRNAVLIEKFRGSVFSVAADYPGAGKLKYEFSGRNIPVLGTDYSDHVTMKILLPQEECGPTLRLITELTNGKAVTEKIKETGYGLLDGKVILDDQDFSGSG